MLRPPIRTAPDSTRHVSPVEATRLYLAHLVEAWNHAFAKSDAGHKLEEQDVVLTVPASIDAAARVNLWKRATSLGGVESLIEHRASIEGPASPCPPDLLRLSAGLEDPDDLYDDLDRALRAADA